jgi:GTP-binding protein
MEIEGDYVKITFIAPTRGLLGYRSEFINDTRGEGSLVRSFERYEEHKGEMPGRTNGVLISQTPGTTMAYALNALSERAQMFVDPAVEVYEGMIIGMNSRKEDMTVNPCKNKKLTNVRASGTDDAVKLANFLNITLDDLINKDLSQVDEFDSFYNANKHLLTDEDKDMIKYIIEKRIK